eukprot:7013010-Ditylum_brightwellii.AAC.1
MLSNNDPADWKQQGGTCIGLVDHMTGQRVNNGEDDKGMSDPGDNMVTAQQQHILTMQQATEQKPRQAWDKDMLKAIKQGKAEGNTVLLVIDVNSGLDDTELAELVAEAGLYDFMGAMHGPHTPKTHI